MRAILIHVALAAFGLLAAASTANATPGVISLGPGLNPDVAIDENGNAHFAWDVRAGGRQDIQYCRIPAGRTACDISRTLSDPDEPSDDPSSGPRVLTRAPDEVIVVSRRCCNDAARPGGSRTSVYLSTDGGATFPDAPRAASSRAPEGDAILGPGQFSFSQIESATQGAIYQAVPVEEGFAEQAANLSTGSSDGAFPQNDATIGLVDSETPIAAMSDLGGGSYYRVFGQGGNPNDIANWKPLVRLDDGSETTLAFGPRGVFLMNKVGGTNARRYVIRKFDKATQTFGGPLNVTQPGNPVFREFHEDGGGNLHTLWREGESLKYRASVDGVTLGPERTLANASEDGDIINIQAGAGLDGEGWAVYEDGGSGSGGPVRAVPIDARAAGGPGQPPPGCVSNVAFGAATAFSVEGCFKTTDNRVFRTTGPVRVNGIDLTPAAGEQAITAGGRLTTTIDRGARTLKTGGPVTVSVGKVILGQKRLDWELPAGPAATVDAFQSTERFGVRLLGFPVSGEVELLLRKGGLSELPANLKLPDFWDGITAKTVLKANSQGLDLRDFGLDVPKFNLGLLGLDAFDISYGGDNPFVFEGKGGLKLPPAGAKLEAMFRLEDGEFASASASFTPPVPLPIVTPVFLKGINFGIRARPKPAQISGGADLIAGPVVAGVAAIEVDGKIVYTFPDPGPAVLEVNAGVLVVGLKLGTGFVRYASNGVFSTGGELAFTVEDVGLRGSFNGFLDIPRSTFQIGAKAEVCLQKCAAGAEFIASTKGLGACADVPLLPPFDDLTAEVGIVWHYDDLPTPYLLGCSVDSIREAQPAGSARAAQAGRNVTLAGGRGAALMIVAGDGAAPRLRVTGPDGVAVDSAEDPTMPGTNGNLTVMSLAQAKKSYVRVRRPAAGAYRIEALPGSAPIADVTFGYEPKPVKVDAQVTGKGRTRTLSYTARNLGGGNVVTFSEAGMASGRLVAGREIGRAKGARGTIRFEPGPGPGGKRNVIALVEQGGVPTSDDVVDTYVAPPPPRPGRPGRPRAKLTGRRLRVSWGAARDARLYQVRVQLRRDGRIVQVQTKKRALTLGGVDAPDVARVIVAGLRPVEGTAGPAASARATLKRPGRRRR